MVRAKIALLTPLVAFSLSGFGAPPDVNVRIDSTTVGENVPIQVLITISRDTGVQVDPASFMMEGKPIQVEPLGEATKKSVSIINGKRSESNTTASRYRFFIPGKEAGVYVVPPISVKVGDQVTTSESAAYQVQTGQESGDLRLEATVQGPNPLYPGQRATFIYRIYFKDNIELTVEKLPLFEAQGFKIIGQKTVSDKVEGGYNVEEISQEVQAVNPGTYSFQGSLIEGYAYNQDIFGRKSYKKERMRSATDPLQVIVKGFPEEGRPADFTGAVGSFEMTVTKRAGDTVMVGDKMELEITIVGDNLQTVELPDVEKQEGFRGRFRFSDLPPASHQTAASRQFVVEVRPLSQSLTEIPSLSFSFFDPRQGRYRTLSSAPIPIVVKPMEAPKEEVIVQKKAPELKEAPKETLKTDEDWRDSVVKVSSIEIAGNYPLEADDLKESFWGSWRALWLLPLGFALLALQVALRRTWRYARLRERRDRSGTLLKRALAKRDLNLLERSLLLRLREEGFIASQGLNLEDLPEETGITSDVRLFLLKVQAERFAGRGVSEAGALLREGKNLFERIHR